MIKPAQRPIATHKNKPLQSGCHCNYQKTAQFIKPDSNKQASLTTLSYQLLTSFCSPKLKIVNLAGSANQLISAMPTVIRAVEMMSCFFSAGSISLTAFISKMSVAKSVVIKQTMMPTELTSSG